MNAQTPTKAAKQQKPGTIVIHGKEYQTVALRVQMFREAHPDWSLTTSVMDRDAQCVVMQATIADTDGRVLATGHAEEYRTSSQINKTSALENAETSAIGRALAALGLGGTEFATANEVQNAIHQQGSEEVVREKVPGIHAIKQRLGKMMVAGDAATELDAFKALVKANRDDIKAIRDANHEWWTGDGEDFEGFGKWMEGRYEALTPVEETLGFQMLASALQECERVSDLQDLMDQHGPVIEALDGEESRRFEQLYNDKEAAVVALANVAAG